MADAGRLSLTRAVAPHRPTLALILLACLMYAPCVWLRDVWNPDEPRYVEVAREMVSRGDYLLPHLNGRVYSEKPPLYFWLGAAAGLLPGVPFASGPRLVSVLAAMGTLLLTFKLGRRLADAETGWLAAMVLATSFMFVLHASSGVIDATLTFLITAAIAVGLRAREEASAALWACFYLLVGLAVLTKGPVGVVVPGGVLLLTALVEDGPRRLWAAHVGWGLLVVAGVSAAWLIPAIARGGESYAEVILLKQNLGRAYESWHHKEPAQFFLKVFPGSFLPWVVVLPGALLTAWRARREGRAARLGLAWFVFTFVFFSLISGKKTRYLLPLFPAASLLVALELRGLLPGARRAGSVWRIRLPVAVCGAALVAAGLMLAAAPFGPMSRASERMDGLAPDQHEALAWLSSPPGALALIVPGLAIAVVAVRGLVALSRDGRLALGCLVTGWIAMVVWAQAVAVPALDVLKSARPLAAAAMEAVGPAGEMALYREEFAAVFNVHTGRDVMPVISGLDRISDWARPRPGAAVFSTVEDLPRLRTRLDLEPLVPCRRVGGDTVCVSRIQAVEPTSRE